MEDDLKNLKLYFLINHSLDLDQILNSGLEFLTKTDEGLNGTTSKEDDLNKRQPQWKTTSSKIKNWVFSVTTGSKFET
jgi:hypothetical protein